MTAALIILAAAAGGAVVAALIGWAVSEWIDRAPESADGPRWDRDYRELLPLCSYTDCDAPACGAVGDFEFCHGHLDALLPASHTPSWV